MADPKYTIEEFIKERNEALLSLDETKIRVMVKKFNGTEMPKDQKVFWGSVHKAITGVQKGLPLEFRQASKDWLTKNGFHSHDDGELK